LKLQNNRAVRLFQPAKLALTGRRSLL